MLYLMNYMSKTKPTNLKHIYNSRIGQNQTFKVDIINIFMMYKQIK